MLPVAVLRSLRQVVQTRARVIVALGGFVCGPVALAGWMLGRRVVLLEQNAVPGWTGRWIGRFATRVYASFPGTERWYPAGRVVVSGNPVRARLVRDVEALRAVQPSPSERVRRVLVFGGSQGARSLNLVLPATMMRAIEGMGWDVRVRHVAGPGNGADVARAWRDAGASLSDDATDTSRGGAVAVTVDEYVDDMAAAYATADLVVCRAGATSLAELAALGLPSVLIPFPWAADDHQTANARAFEEAGAARSVSDAAIDADETVGLLRDLLSDAQVLGVMGESARTLARSDAAEWLATEIARAAGVDEALDSRGPEHGTTTAAQHGEAR
jgi:UDP-N-acetylglucosamine--N-acetylmuramyl-(pentapeptide) pyrophosphoryl-undecaprenol N-acetylglucosamine transferase